MANGAPLIAGVRWPLLGRHGLFRTVAALALIAAAGLKFHQLSTSPLGGTGIFHDRWFLTAVASAELLIGVLLLAGAWPRPVWLLALVSFALFAGVSLAKAISGETGCGCFGELSVSPWFTATFDIAVLVALACSRPIARSLNRRRMMAALLGWLLIIIPASYAVAGYEEATLTDAGEIVGDGRVVELKPETWVGKTFPLLGHIDIGDKLASGLWLVLLHRHDCSSCREAAAEYESIAKEFAKKPGSPRVALIDCPPFARPSRLTADPAWATGRMDDAAEWHIPGPIVLLVDGGQVQNVFKNALDTELIEEIWR